MKTISDLITQMANSKNVNNSKKIDKLFPDTDFGVIVIGLPNLAPGSKYKATQNELTISSVIGPNGKDMIKACADPDLFIKNFKENITATMTGRELIDMIMRIPDCDGVLICSATSFNSYPILKERFPSLIKEKRKWYKFW